MSDLVFDLAIRSIDWPKPEIVNFRIGHLNWSQTMENQLYYQNMLFFVALQLPVLSKTFTVRDI